MKNIKTMQKSKLTDATLYSLVLLAVIALYFLACILSCHNEEPAVAISDITQPFDPYNHSIDYTQPLEEKQLEAAAMISPCDSIYYEPLAYGAQLRILKNTISNGSRKGSPWWQAKTFAWQRIVPTNYQQDSVRERVVIADRDTIYYTDTFYICRKKHL